MLQHLQQIAQHDAALTQALLLCMQCNAVLGSVALSFGSTISKPSGTFTLPPVDLVSVKVKAVNEDGNVKKASTAGIIEYFDVRHTPKQECAVHTSSVHTPE